MSTNQHPTKTPTTRLNTNGKRLLQHQHFDGEDGDEYGATEFGGFRAYMANKRRKLQNQALEALRQEQQGAGSTTDTPNAQAARPRGIFTGCIVYINGYTGVEHSVEELRRMLVAHGGVFVQHMVGKTSVTHIVATTLTTRKKIQFEKYRVVTPDWVPRCIEAGKVLDWRLFRTVPEFLPRGQTKLFASTGTSTTPRHVNATDGHNVRQAATESAVLPHTEPLTSTNTNDEYLYHETKPGVPSITDPAFITHFYQHSRLHHLSMWKAAVRQKYLVRAAAAAVTDSCWTQRFASTLTQNKRGPRRVILHIDFDSFFASVAVALRPNLNQSMPVCVASGTHAHSDIASCNYAARALGVRNGMLMKRAKTLCPDLIVLGYDFDAYEKASLQMYEAVMEVGADLVYPVSVDEVMLDITGWIARRIEEVCKGASGREGEDSSVDASPLAERERRIEEQATALGNTLRTKIRARTQLETSVGIGPNVMLTRVALAKAKPGGVYCINWSTRYQSLIPAAPGDKEKTIGLRDLPGVGRHIVAKLEDAPLRIRTFEDLSRYARGQHTQTSETASLPTVAASAKARETLESVFGPKLGVKLWEFGQGIDDTDLRDSIATALERKSVGVEISWGVRATCRSDVVQFVRNLSQELGRRLADGGISYVGGIMSGGVGTGEARTPAFAYTGRSLTVKVYRTKKDADPRRAKAMGHGECDIYSRTRAVPAHAAPTRDAVVIADTALALLDTMECAPLELRGLGIQMTKLEADGGRLVKGKGKGGDGGKTMGILKFVERPAAAPAEPSREPAASSIKTPQSTKKNARVSFADFDSDFGSDFDSDEAGFDPAAPVLGILAQDQQPRDNNKVPTTPTETRVPQPDALGAGPDAEVAAPSVDWDTYYAIPSTLRKLVKEEYNLVSTPRNEHKPQSHIDWDTYYAIPSTLRKLVKEEYNLGSTPRGQQPGKESPVEQRGSVGGDSTTPTRAAAVPLLEKIRGFRRETRSAPPAAEDPLARVRRQAGPGGQVTLTQQRAVSLAGLRGRAPKPDAATALPPAGHDILAHPSLLDAATLAELPAEVATELRGAVARRRRWDARQARLAAEFGGARGAAVPAPEPRARSVALNGRRPAAYRDRAVAPSLDGCAADEGGGVLELRRFGEVCKVVREWIKETIGEGAADGAAAGDDGGACGEPHDETGGGECGESISGNGGGGAVGGEAEEAPPRDALPPPPQLSLVASAARSFSSFSSFSFSSAQSQDSPADPDPAPGPDPDSAAGLDPKLGGSSRSATCAPLAAAAPRLSPPRSPAAAAHDSGPSAAGPPPLRRPSGDDASDTSDEDADSDGADSGGGPHPADVALFAGYVARLVDDPLRWPHAVRLSRWVAGEVASLAGEGSGGAHEWHAIARRLRRYVRAEILAKYGKNVSP